MAVAGHSIHTFFGIKAKSPGANLEKKVFGLTDLHHGVSCNGKKLKGKVGGGGVQAVQVDLEVDDSLKILKSLLDAVSERESSGRRVFWG
ncbi:unnamed protein product [Malus baccata var. baccata]